MVSSISKESAIHGVDRKITDEIPLIAEMKTIVETEIIVGLNSGNKIL